MSFEFPCHVRPEYATLTQSATVTDLIEMGDGDDNYWLPTDTETRHPWALRRFGRGRYSRNARSLCDGGAQ